MRLFINILTVSGIILALFNAGLFIYGWASGGFADGKGMVALIFLLWGFIGATFALVFGFIGRMMDRKRDMPISRISNIGIAIGIIGGLLGLIFPFL